MKKHICVSILIISMFILLTIGCKNTDEVGSLSLKMSYTQIVSKKTTKTILPTVDININSYNIFLSGPDNESVSTAIDSSGIVTVDDLAVGEWTIQVTALNSDELPIGTGQEVIQILSHQTVESEIIVMPFDGEGALIISVTWDSELIQSGSITGKLNSSIGLDPIEFTLTEENNNYENNALTSGFYTLYITLYENDELYGGAVDVVRIFADRTTEATIHVQTSLNDGGAGIVIIPEMNDPIDLILSGNLESITEGESFTVSADPVNTSSVIFTWYIDGIQKIMGADEDSYSVPNDLNTGTHRLDLTVFTSDGKRGGSASHIFEVTPVVIPNVPDNLTASAISQDQVSLTWNDNSINEQCFYIERSLNSIFTDPVVIEIGQDISSYLNNQLTSETEYFYRISAYNSAGYSGYSNEVSCTTLAPNPTGAIIIDHNSIDIHAIPVSAITQAKSDLHIAYGHSSHGAQIKEGLRVLDEFMTNNGAVSGAYAIDMNGDVAPGALDFRDNFEMPTRPFPNAIDLGTPNYTTWIQDTRNYLNANPEVNVIMWMWCGHPSYCSDSVITNYLNNMTQLENDYPNVHFVYMTGHVDGTGLEGTLRRHNEMIRNHCIDNNKILYDFADIESWGPDGIYYGDKYVKGSCNYDYNGNGVTEQEDEEANGWWPPDPINGDRNWALDWQNSHTLDVDWYECKIRYFHTQHLNDNLKAYAAWWLFARIAGWDGQ